LGNITPCTIEPFTAFDGYTWLYRHYPPNGEALANVVFIHGIQSHGGWYTYSSTRLAQEGYAVYFLDRRGAGLNEEGRGDAPSYHRILSDIADFLRWLRRTSKLPVFLIGISWGGKPATALWRFHPWLYEGLGLLCPGFFPKYKSTLKQFLRLTFTYKFRPNAKFVIPLNEPELFTEVPRWRQFLADDPLILRQGTARFIYANGLLDFSLANYDHWIPKPVLLMLAEKDRIIHNEPTRRFIYEIAEAGSEVIEYPGEHHTLEFGYNPDIFIQDLLSWLRRQPARITGSPS
jgi:alpha-beta hydrolase superfamily lysophospholipase